MNFETISVNTWQKIALDFLIIEFIKAEQVIKVDNVIILREDVVSSSDMSDVGEVVLLPYH